MTFINLLQGTVDKQIIYFDGDGRIYEKHPVQSHYTPTNRFVYYEFYNKPIIINGPYNAAVGCEEYKIEYEIKDEQNAIIPRRMRNARK